MNVYKHWGIQQINCSFCPNLRHIPRQIVFLGATAGRVRVDEMQEALAADIARLSNDLTEVFLSSIAMTKLEVDRAGIAAFEVTAIVGVNAANTATMRQNS